MKVQDYEDCVVRLKYWSQVPRKDLKNHLRTKLGREGMAQLIREALIEYLSDGGLHKADFPIPEGVKAPVVDDQDADGSVIALAICEAMRFDI